MTGFLANVVWPQWWQVTVLFCGMLLLSRTWFRRHPHWAHTLWMVSLVKCLVPPLWSSHLGLFSWCQLSLHDADILTSSSFSTQSSAWIRENLTPGLAHLLVAVWLGGVLICGCLVALRWRNLQKAITRSSAPVPVIVGPILRKLVRRLPVKNVRVHVTAEPVGPAVLGVFRKAIILPRTLVDGLPAAELEPILAHELLHIRRGDTWASVLQVLAKVVWWHHPLVWWGARDSSNQCERSVDGDVIRILKYSRPTYARCLLNVLEARCRLHPAIGSVGLSSLQLTEERLRSVLEPPASPASRDRRGLRYLAAGLLALGCWPGSGLVLGSNALVPIQEWRPPPLGHVCEVMEGSPLPLSAGH